VSELSVRALVAREAEGKSYNAPVRSAGPLEASVKPRTMAAPVIAGAEA